MLGYGLGRFEVSLLQMQLWLELNFPSIGLPGGQALAKRAATAATSYSRDPEISASNNSLCLGCWLSSMSCRLPALFSTCLPSPGSWDSTLARRAFTESRLQYPAQAAVCRGSPEASSGRLSGQPAPEEPPSGGMKDELPSDSSCV